MMARVERRAPRPAKEPAAAPADDLDVLFPDVAVTIGKRTIAAREFTFAEQIDQAAALADVTAAISIALMASAAGAPDVTLISAALDSRGAEMARLIAVSTGLSVDEIYALPASDAENLALAFWSANRSFFLRRLVGSLTPQAASAGGASSPI